MVASVKDNMRIAHRYANTGQRRLSVGETRVAFVDSCGSYPYAYGLGLCVVLRVCGS